MEDFFNILLEPMLLRLGAQAPWRISGGSSTQLEVVQNRRRTVENSQFSGAAPLSLENHFGSSALLFFGSEFELVKLPVNQGHPFAPAHGVRGENQPDSHTRILV